MKKTLALFTFIMIGVPLLAQESMNKVMENRAREMYRVIGLNEPESWKKFIKENYTKALIDKPMQAKKQTSDGSRSSGGTSTQEGNIEGKAAMYQMLHNDFAGGKISSLKSSGETLTMVVTGGDMTGTFTLRFSKEKPWLIDGIGIEVGN